MTGTEIDEEFIMQTFAKVAEVEDQLTVLEDEQRLEEAKIQHKFDLKKADIYKKRNEIVSQIPGFWLSALQNHGVFNGMLTEEDEELLESLTSMSVDRDANDERLFKIRLTFGENQVFKNTELVKEMISKPDGTITVKDTAIEWKTKSGDKRKVLENSFVGLFQDDSEDAVEIANILITDFYPNAVSYYQGVDGDDDDEETLDGEEDLEDEE